MLTLDLIIVNWNAGPQLADCLHAVAASVQDTYALERVVVVDNASTDDSLKGLDRLGLPIVVIRNDENRGFAAACNQGAHGSRADYQLFLNPDTRVEPDTLEQSLRFLEQPEHREIGLLGVQLVDDKGRVSRTCARFPDFRLLLGMTVGLDHLAPGRFRSLVMTEWDHADSRFVDHVMGAYFLTRRSVFETLGGFDEGFYVYFEDLDYALRARQAGWATYYLTDARLFHKGCGTSEQVKDRRLFYALQSRIYYGHKHFPPVQAFIHTAGILTVELAARLGRAALRRSAKEAGATLRAYRMLYGSLPSMPFRRIRHRNTSAAPRAAALSPAAS